MRRVLFWFLAVCVPLHSQMYVSPDGSDDNAGSIDKPFKSINKAVIKASPQDTIYVRGGVHEIIETVSIGSAKSGTADRIRVLRAFPGEKPLLDFSNSAFGAKGFYVKASWWHFADLEIAGAGDNGMQIAEGSNNLVERCIFRGNRDSGLQLSSGASNNAFIDCDSYHNADPPDYGDADGFAPKLDVGSGNTFIRCRSWGNCDDGWDGYMRGASDVTTVCEACWTWGNGYLKDGSDPGTQANGNGFKMGGGDNSNGQNLMHHFILKNCLAAANKNKGFDQNNNVGSMTLLNCTGYGNAAANYRIMKTLMAGQALTVTNCVSFDGGVELGPFAVQEKNGWMAPFVVGADDFSSLDFPSMAAPRKADGGLPDIDFMHLAPGSDLVDAGVPCGLPYSGAAPDLGAFENSESVAAGRETVGPGDLNLKQNFPNPFSAGGGSAYGGNPQTTIRFHLPRSGRVALTVYSVSGKETAVLMDGPMDAGAHEVRWRPGNIPSGIYFARLQSAGSSRTIKLMLQK